MYIYIYISKTTTPQKNKNMHWVQLKIIAPPEELPGMGLSCKMQIEDRAIAANRKLKKTYTHSLQPKVSKELVTGEAVEGAGKVSSDTGLICNIQRPSEI